MSLALFNEFLSAHCGEDDLEKICEELAEDDKEVKAEVEEKETEVKVEKLEEGPMETVAPAAAPPVAPPVDKETPAASDPPVVSNANTLEDYGVLTDLSKRTASIDEEHTVILTAQKLSHLFTVGQNVRYSYRPKGDLRKDVVVLECLAKGAANDNPPKKEKVEENWDRKVEVQNTTTSAVFSATTTTFPALAEDPNGTKQWSGTVTQCQYDKSSGDVSLVFVRFPNGVIEHIELTPKICKPDYKPREEDRVVVECLTEPGDEDEEAEQYVEALQILPAGESGGTGTITELNETLGIIDEDIYFLLNGEEQLEVGKFLEYTAVPSVRAHFKWRCVTVKLTDSLQQRRSDYTDNLEYIGNPECHKDRNGLVIVNRAEVNFRMFSVGGQMEQKIIFKNTGKTPYRLVNVYICSARGRCLIRLKNKMRPVMLNPNQVEEIRIVAHANYHCNHEEFAIAAFSRDMWMVLPIRIAVGSDEVVRSQNVHERVYQAARGVVKMDEEPQANTQVWRATRNKTKFVEVRIKPYPIPVLLWGFMCGELKEFEDKCHEKYPFLEEPLTTLNYFERLHQMVYISEAYLKRCFRIYDMTDVRFEKEGEFYRLALENLGESRPSVLLEDTVVAKEGNNIFTGALKVIFNDRVLFEFHEQFNEAHREKRYNVSFRLNRTPFKKLHHALDEVEKKYGENFLFPESVEEKEPLLDLIYDCAEDETDEQVIRKPMELRTANGEIKQVPWLNEELNKYQKRAIVNALRAECRPMPYLICGPPGTGKTSTLVELVLQQFRNNPRSHILVCTPSNSAATLILEKLIESDELLKTHFIRVLGYQAKEKDKTPPQLRSYCGTVEKSKEGTEGRELIVEEDGFREGCQREYLERFNIIILTIGSVGTFMEMGFPADHFTHLYVDEAAQCLEAEMLIPMSLLSKAKGHTVFVGDEMQLGPVVQFHPLEKWGYGVSLFERLQRFPMYDRSNVEQYDQRLCYQLKNSYRALPSIMHIYNRQFYNQTLIPMILDESEVEYECLRQVTPIFPVTPYRTKNAGAYFYAITGDCRRTTSNPSWINPQEMKSVTRFYKKLLDLGVSAMDVGIISPYQEQVRVIMSDINSEKLELPKIGSVEEFQGQERMIILISTVRSKKRGEDQKFGLGFVGHPKRVNVALSRARAVLVVFGNPAVLGDDTNWRQYIRYCEKSMTYKEDNQKE